MKDTPLIVGVALVAVAIGVYFFLQGGFPSLSVPTVSESQSSAVAVPFTLLASGSRSTITERVNYFITSATELKELWKLVDAPGTLPEVDFTREAVIAVFAGQQPTAGYRIAVSKVVDSDARLVSITIQKPDSTCVVGQVLTAPYEVVTIPTTMLPLAHEDIATTADCK